MKFLPYFFSVLSCCLLSACSSFDDVHFDQKAKESLSNMALIGVDTDYQQPTISISQLINIDEANVLIASALNNNPSLQQALITLKTAEQQLIISSSAQWPSITGGINADKSEVSKASYSSSIDVAWTLDIWQKLADTSQAEKANAIASAYAFQGAQDLLVANVMKAYLELVQFTQLISIETERVKAHKTNEHIIINRYRKGLVELNELDTAQSSTQSSQATLVNYQAQYQQALRDLILLTGVTKNQLDYRLTFPKVSLPLASVEKQNLGRRPDLQQAYQNIIASQYQHKVAYKALLPNLSLSASLTNSDTNLHDALFGSNAWQLLGQLSAPLFNAGKLNSEIEVAKLNAEKSYWSFQETLLTAVNEVDSAIAQEKSINQRLALIESALISAKRSETIYIARYRQGTVSLIDLLNIQQQTFSLQTQVTQLKYEKLSNRISLGLALGLGV